MIKEKFKPLAGYKIPGTNENMILVSNYGRIFHNGFSESKELFIGINNRGLKYFRFTYKGKRITKLVGKVVLETFKGFSKNKKVRYIDGDKTNTYIGNLEYISHQKMMSNLWKNGLIESKSGKFAPMYNKKGKKHPKSYKIQQLDGVGNVVQVRNSINEVKRKKNWAVSNISNAIKNNKRSYGFFWKKIN